MPATTQSLTNNVHLAATLQRREKGYVDQISRQIPLFYWLKRKGSYKSVPGGERIEWNVEYELDTSEMSYHGMDVATLVEPDRVTVAIANWKQYRASIVASGLDIDVKNAGSEKVFDLLEQRESNALLSLQTNMNVDFYGDGTANGGKVVTGFDAIAPENPTTGTLFGINRATAGNEYWRSRIVDQGSTGTAIAAYSSGTFNMRRGMIKLRQLCGRGGAGGASGRYPDLILCSEAYFRTYDDALSQSGQGQKFVDKAAADAGFTTLQFMGGTMIEDEDCPDDRTNTGTGTAAIFVNSKFLQLCYHPNRNFKVSPELHPVNQDAVAYHIYWAGELIAKNCNKHGRHIGIASVG